MSIINDYLDYISTANYGSDVREAIVSSIRECYKDATGHPDSVAALVQEYIDREESIDDKVSLLTGLYNSLGDIVYSYDYNNGVSGIHIAENEFGCVDQITLGPGKWIIKIVSFFSRIINASPNVGTIYLSFSNTLDSDGFPIPLNDTYNYKDDLYYGTILKSVGSHTHFIKMIELTEERTIYMWIQHDGALSDDIVVSPHMIAMKIGESTPSDGTSLADQVVENTGDIAVLEGKVATNISDISTLDSDVDALEEDVADIEDEIADVKADLSEVIVNPIMRNGTTGNLQNANAICTKNVIDYNDCNSVKIKINKPFKSNGNWYRLVISTYSINGIETANNNNYRVTMDKQYNHVTELILYKGLLDDTSVSFGFNLVEYDSSDNVVPMRITDITTSDVVIYYDNADLSVINEKVDRIEDTIIYSIHNLTNYNKENFQYLPSIDRWDAGYWDGNTTKVSSNSYKCTKICGLKAGTYYVTGVQEWQSLIENVDSGDITTFHALGISSNTDGTFTVDYDFNLYVTTSKINTPSSMFSNAELPPIWRGGFYGVDGDTYHVEKSSYGGEFTSLVDAINYATQFMDSIVYVGDGEWDILAELGNDYLAEVSSSKRGLYLKNRIHLICSSRSKITANYDGNVTGVKQWFAVFNSGKYGFTIENATIEGSNIRYIVHDERDQDADAYTNKYINTSMYFDNSENDAWNSKACIGGGLGRNGYILIDGCIFDSVGGFHVVTYHNTAASNGKSMINIRNCYFKRRNTIRLSWYGTSTEITNMYVCGCYLGLPILVEAENASATVENVVLTKWGNTELPA